MAGIMGENSLRALVSVALEQAGDPWKASLAADPLCTMLGEPWDIPGGALVVLFEAVLDASASFYAGIVGDQVFLLTGSPGSFEEMIRASGLRITEPGTAIEVACAYEVTTRPMHAFSGVIHSLADTDWSPAKTVQQRQAVSEFKERLTGIVRLPAAKPTSGGSHNVTLYVMRDDTVERRTLTITPDGGITERCEIIADGPPVPVDM